MAFNGIRRKAGKGPKYMRTLPSTIIASWPIAAVSTSTFNKHLSPTGRGIEPNKDAQYHQNGQKSARGVRHLT